MATGVALASAQAFVDNGRSRDEELSQLRRELRRVTKERDFLRETAAFFAERRDEVSDDPTMPRHVFHPIDVPMFASLPEWVLRLGNAPAECPYSGQHAAGGAHARPAHAA